MECELVLFDIDGTLVDSRNAGRAAFVGALKSVFGWTDNIDYIRFSGATDLDVLDQIFRRCGRQLTESDTELFFAELPRQLQERCAEMAPVVLPGVNTVLDVLADRPACLVGLVTGNIDTCARIKLEAAGIDHDFAIGAFGHEHADRNEIARLAVGRAKGLLGEGRSIGRIILVGDSPADVRAAQAIGAQSLAVCTGHPQAEELTAAGADYVVEDLTQAMDIL